MKPTLVLDEPTLRELQASALFSHVGPESIRRCLAHGEESSFAPGQVLVRDGQEVPAFIIQLDGELRVIKRYPSQAGEGSEQEVLLKTTQPGDFMGEIPLLLQAPLDVDVVATKPTRVIMLGPDAFWAMLGSCPVTSRVILRAMAYRIRNKESFNQQREKLASLGTMAAGLAHELNNPASAARRAVDGLEPAIQNWHVRSLRLATLRAAQGPGETGRDDGGSGGDQLARLEGDALARAAAAAGQKLDALLQSEREDDVAHWLDARGVEESWQLAPTLVQAGLDPAWLENFARALPAALLTEAVCWLEASLTVRSLLRDAGHSIERVSELVKAVKSYTYLDRAQAQQEVNVHEGLETTLTMLGHKLKGVEVIRDFDRTLPLVCAYGTELNQVWTNLLDNAADAVSRQPHGRIRLRTHRDGENHVCVEIADNGGGIPPEIKRRLFEPFFTTKEVGKGSGLGLVISHRIVAERHGGEIEILDHTPGETCFSVRLPIRRTRNLAAGPTAAPTLAGRPTEWTDPPTTPVTGPTGS